jgi:RNA polymerase sigma-70 factor (ECF subfamily)
MSERAEFASWYREQHPRLLAALTVVAGSADVAADATSEAFVRAYERWDRVRGMDSPDGWLYRVALNVVRRRARRLGFERDLLRRTTPRPSAESAPSALHPEVWEAVRALPDRQRAAVGLRYLLDLREAEVAALMGVTRGAASSYLTTARRTLAARLSTDLADDPWFKETHHG